MDAYNLPCSNLATTTYASLVFKELQAVNISTSGKNTPVDQRCVLRENVVLGNTGGKTAGKPTPTATNLVAESNSGGGGVPVGTVVGIAVGVGAFVGIGVAGALVFRSRMRNGNDDDDDDDDEDAAPRSPRDNAKRSSVAVPTTPTSGGGQLPSPTTPQKAIVAAAFPNSPRRTDTNISSQISSSHNMSSDDQRSTASMVPGTSNKPSSHRSRSLAGSDIEMSGGGTPVVPPHMVPGYGVNAHPALAHLYGGAAPGQPAVPMYGQPYVVAAPMYIQQQPQPQAHLAVAADPPTSSGKSGRSLGKVSTSGSAAAELPYYGQPSPHDAASASYPVQGGEYSSQPHTQPQLATSASPPRQPAKSPTSSSGVQGQLAKALEERRAAAAAAGANTTPGHGRMGSSGGMGKGSWR
ncbi:hypothetical protein HDU93_002381 [Gonapodya sp. JEL0774]|nr:hypothetical protein HDU93_002381 [Gonapodya sp. JEL0774]